ncbi:alpha/beta hydrolase [Nonomuraea sp. FMUSA5-5]|uniref:Alpha/beta hydrolase n=1 Tax=Nonomuraea composti TaxID=2720023 RepID=A0ABX1B278_9ACTN|nr:alpha/beta hydrolase [Nonomuraea sp. FMUSA5-5]NJP90419.1 alpha/beta hydrolase [Nonomuraea sp. FMUSA5-5]
MTAIMAAGMLALTCAAPVSAAIREPSAPAVPELRWSPCHEGFQCATAQLPLDYRQPDGKKIDIAVVRHLATDPAHRIGTLFVNGGGPSAQIDPTVAQYATLPADWRARFDVVTFDPRGFGYSTPAQCFADTAAEDRFLADLPVPFPVGAKEIAATQEIWARFDRECVEHADPGLLAHNSTANAARDLDLLRQAIGDPQLNYLGLSYGTVLGTIYANLFPGKVGRMVLDSNIDPVRYTTAQNDLPTYLRLGSDKASASTLKAFLDLCGKASTAACAFSTGTPAKTRAKFDTLLERLRRRPVTVDGPPGTCGYACALATVPLRRVRQWQAGASQLQQLWTATTKGGDATAGPVPKAEPDPGAGPSYYTGQEQALAVICSDSPNPRDPLAYEAGARLARARSGPIGLTWAWPTAPCAGWPRSQDRYEGPWNARTANPILLVGITGDPATPYQNSVTLSRHLANSRLLTVDGYGHTALANPSACASTYETGYLLTGALPPAGTVCEQDDEPFPEPAAR